VWNGAGLAAPAAFGASANVRPAAGPTPSTENKSADAARTLMFSARSAMRTSRMRPGAAAAMTVWRGAESRHTWYTVPGTVAS